MGLDIYLGKCPNLDAATAAEAEYSKRSHARWEAVGDYNSLSKEQKDALAAADRADADELGLDEGGGHPSRSSPEVPESKVDPEHLFKLDYLRSSYNGSGFNRVMRDAGAPDLYEIFGRGDKDPYHWQPDWRASLDRVNFAIDAWERHIAAPGGNVRVLEVSSNDFMNPADLPQSEADALEIYRREAGKKHSPDFRSYGNRDGDFYLDGLTVRALIPGMTERLIGSGKKHVIYAVIDAHADEGKEDWYLTALKITREMIEHVLAQPDANDYYLGWSA